jgi:copper chaperone CopZ
MKNLKSLFTGKILIFAFLLFCVIAAAVSFAYKSSTKVIQPQIVTQDQKAPAPAKLDADLSKMVLSVQGMSCSGCIATIKGAVSDIKGIRDTLVDVGSGKVEIYYDNKGLKDVSRVAEAITASGYPAGIRKILSPDEIRKESALAEAKAQYYIASVGGYEIARTDFDTELTVAKKKYSKIYGNKLFESPQGQALLNNLRAQVVSKLINEGVFMQEISKTRFKVDPVALENELNVFLRNHGKTFEEFNSSLIEAGYDPNYFRKKFETKVQINRYLNERILANASNDFERQSLFKAWYSNAKSLAEVVYYDKRLERLVQSLSASRSCGGSS